MKKTFLLAAACLMAFAGCDQNDKINVMEGGVRMTLATDCAELITRATEPGVDDLNENLISSIHYYFFDTTTSTDDTTYVFDGVQNVNSTGSAEFALSGITSAIYDNIFNNGSRTSLYVYVVANAGSATLPAGSGTLNAIRGTVLSLTGDGKQDNLVMTGNGTLTYTGSGSNRTAETSEIKLKRVASKITLHLIVPISYKDLADKEWFPQLDKVQIDFKHVEKKGLVSAVEPNTLDTINVTRMASNSDDLISSLTSDAKSTEISLTVPVYSYPREWENGDASTPYIYITIPWVYGTVEEKTYYKILLPGNSLEPNCWYDITAKLGGLGSLVKEGTVTIDLLNINVSKDWKDAIPDGNNTDADIAMPRVLALEQNTYVIYNQNSIVIPFVSSHNCTLVEASADEITVNNLDGNKESDIDGRRTGETVSCTVDNSTRTITFTHKLTNMGDKDPDYFDFQEFVHSYKLYHTDEDSYCEYITIHQFPSLTVVPYDNDGQYTNVFVSNHQKTSTGTLNSSYYYRLGGSANNHNVYTVTVSVLPTSGTMSGYTIGDPRVRTNQMSTSPYSDDDLKNVTDADGNKLTYYYPANASTANIIAPKFRIASAYGGLGTIVSAEFAQKRCAGYQEAGYPAGRWRLPTKAELVYCALLQEYECIKDKNGNSDIFRPSTDYWCADGYIYKSGVLNSTSTTASIRCVYDAWYWDETSFSRLDASKYENSVATDNNYFTWGDKEITW